MLKVNALKQFAEPITALIGDTLSNPVFETWEIAEFKVRAGLRETIMKLLALVGEVLPVKLICLTC